MKPMLRGSASFFFAGSFFLSLAILAPPACAKSALEIDASVKTALDYFEKEVPGAKDMLAKAKGVLVFPSVIKAGFVVGGEYGTGALQIAGVTVDYYNTIGGSLGFQFGGQARRVYLLFMEESALKDFQEGDGWQVGVDGSVALVTLGVDGSVDTTKTNQPIVAFVLDQKGFMGNLTLEGSRFNKITPA
ncbi:MAG: YSC84-related protein [Candidatus Omnitrophota bacterium]